MSGYVLRPALVTDCTVVIAMIAPTLLAGGPNRQVNAMTATAPLLAGGQRPRQLFLLLLLLLPTTAGNNNVPRDVERGCSSTGFESGISLGVVRL